MASRGDWRQAFREDLRYITFLSKGELGVKYIIIGNGAAGMAAAEAVRDRDGDGEIVIYTDEDRFHYSRPRIIEYLGGSIDADKLTIRKEDYY
jgi:nitrite reductase (NADH) large subunit